MPEGQVQQPATPPHTPIIPASEPARPARVQRSGSLREAPPDRVEIKQSTAEEQIVSLLNPKLKGKDLRHDQPAYDELPSEDREERDAEFERRKPRKESPRVAEEREQAEARTDDGLGDGETVNEDVAESLDDTPDPTKAATDAIEDFEYTDEASGRKYIVPKPLVEGAMRQADYTKATQQVAAERQYNAALKQNLEVDQAINADLAPAVSQIQQLDQHIQQLRLQKNQPGITVERYIEIDRQLSSLTDTREEYMGAVTKRRTELSAQKQAVVAALQSAADNHLSKTLPKWTDPVRRAVQQHMVDEGMAPEEISGMYDPRIIKAFHDAALLKKIQSKRDATVRQRQAAAPVVRPQGRASNATTETQQIGRLKANAQRTGRDADAVTAIDRMLKQSRERAARR